MHRRWLRIRFASCTPSMRSLAPFRPLDSGGRPRAMPKRDVFKSTRARTQILPFRGRSWKQGHENGRDTRTLTRAPAPPFHVPVNKRLGQPATTGRVVISDFSKAVDRVFLLVFGRCPRLRRILGDADTDGSRAKSCNVCCSRQAGSCSPHSCHPCADRCQSQRNSVSRVVGFHLRQGQGP